MTLSLHEAYIMLQLDPDNTRQMASFEALSWKYILKYSSFNWQQNTKAGATQLTWRADISTGGSASEYCEFHDETLNWITYQFVRAQALRLWPTFGKHRSHLLALERGRVIIGDRVIYLSAQHSLMASRPNMKVQRHRNLFLQRLHGGRLTAQETTVESLVGGRVRGYLKALLLSQPHQQWNVPPAHSESFERLVSKIVLGEAPPTTTATQTPPTIITTVNVACPYNGCDASFDCSEALDNH